MPPTFAALIHADAGGRCPNTRPPPLSLPLTAPTGPPPLSPSVPTGPPPPPPVRWGAEVGAGVQWFPEFFARETGARWLPDARRGLKGPPLHLETQPRRGILSWSGAEAPDSLLPSPPSLTSPTLPHPAPFLPPLSPKQTQLKLFSPPGGCRGLAPCAALSLHTQTHHTSRPHTSRPHTLRHSCPGIARRMNASISGTVNAVSPWFGLHNIPFSISIARVGACD